MAVAIAGQMSGPIGSLFIPVAKGMQAWASSINQKGGLNGHQVRLILYDDGGDRARHLAQIHDAVERQKVVAIAPIIAPLTGRATIDYLTERRVPVIGSELGSPFMYESPMYFPQATTNPYIVTAGLRSLAQQLAPQKTKLGTFVCVESDVCSSAEATATKRAEAEGLKYVYKVKVSVAQPDFTAECLSARNAGAEMLFFGMDAASLERVALSCARQDYHPVFSTASAGITDRFKDNSNLDGFAAAVTVFPYFGTGLPAMDEFLQALRTYASGESPSVGGVVGWTAGKLLERAGAAMPEPPTSEALLQGLWSMKDDTLGGLTQPLSFVKDHTATPVECWFNIAIKNKTWISPDGFKQYCRPGSPL